MSGAFTEAADGARLRPFSATHVLYEDGDRFGQLMALLSLTPIFVMVAYATLVARCRDLATLALLVGQLGNEVLNYALKHLIKEERPFTVHQWSPKYGMPSNHSQFMAFWAAWLSLWALRKWGAPRPLRLAGAGAVQALSTAVMYSRVFLKYHTYAQVGAGFVVGTVAGALWYAAVEVVLRPRFAGLADSWIGRTLLLMDCTHCDNVLVAEYNAIRACSGSAATPRSTSRKQR